MRTLLTSRGFAVAGAHFLQLLARAGDLKAMGFHRKTEFLAHFVFELFDLCAVELDDLVAVLADDMVVMRVLGVVRVVKLVVATEIHFVDEPAFGEKGRVR